MCLSRPASFLAALLATAVVAQGEDRLVTFGGGGDASNNQISLEKNILYYSHLLKAKGLSRLDHTIFFADGVDPGRDLQFQDPSWSPPRINSLLAQILGSTDGLELQYRSHELTSVGGPSSTESLDKYLDQTCPKLAAGDRMIFYFTGHGSRGGGKTPHDTTLNLWNNQSISASQFTQRLDRLAPDVGVVLVMVQCYSGGFANVIFQEANPTKDLADRPRCGFFATTQDRTAAGCTADIDEENYQEYSTFFWAGLWGRTRTGQPVPPPDHNGDGRVSFAEAHAYVQVASNTIDIPVKTSDAFLRRYSRTEPPLKPPPAPPKEPVAPGPEEKAPAADPAAAPAPNPDPAPAPEVPAAPEEEYLKAEAPYETLIQAAGPNEKAVLEGLSLALGLEGQERTAMARKLAESSEAQRKDLEKEKREARSRYDNARRGLSSSLKSRWPELGNPWHPTTQELLAGQSQTVLEVIESHPDWQPLGKAAEELSVLEEKILDKERQWAKTQRFIRTAQSVALEANLPKVASPEIQQRYKALVDLEGSFLDSLPPRQETCP